MTAGPQDVPRITDDAMLAAAASMQSDDFQVLEALADGEHEMLLRFTISNEPGTFAIRLPLPSSTALKPWLYVIPDDADDASGSLQGFLDEETATGCSQWAAMTSRGADSVFELAPYGFRRADPKEHQRLLKSSGPTGWNGYIRENDDPADTPWGRHLAHLATLPLSYPEVGATRGALPTGYRHLEMQQISGEGEAWFRTVSDRLLTWEVHRRAGLLVSSRCVTLGGDCVISLRVGPEWVEAPVRVVDIVDEPTVQGFAYGTLRGHPETGEERFLIHLDPDGTVRAEIRAFSRPGRWYTRLGAPIARYYQRAVTRRYLRALTYQPHLDDRALDD